MSHTTLYDKIWQAHLVDEQDDGNCLLYMPFIMASFSLCPGR